MRSALFTLVAVLGAGSPLAWAAQADQPRSESSPLPADPAVLPDSGTEATPSSVEGSPELAVAADVLPPCTNGTVPALTPVLLELVSDAGSKLSKTGDPLSFRLARPLVLGSCMAAPAGTPATGEVIEAKRASFMGAGGEFVGAARFLDLGDRRVRLRSLQMKATGGDRIVWGVSTGSSVLVFSQTTPGSRNIEYPAGTVVEAKLAEPLTINAAVAPVQPEGAQ